MQETSQESERPFRQKEANSCQREEADRATVFIKCTVSAAEQHLNSVDFLLLLFCLAAFTRERETNLSLNGLES